MSETTTRRRLLIGTGSAGAVLLAGCTDDGDGDTGGESMDDSMDDENDSMDETSTDDTDG